MKTTTKRSNVGVDLIRILANEGHRIFSTQCARELSPRVGLKDAYLLEALHHLHRNGWILPLRRGLYAISHGLPGTVPVHEFEIAMALVTPAAISHWSALSYHGLTDQTPRHVFALTTAPSLPRVRGLNRSADRTGFIVSGTVYRFVKVQPERFFGLENIWVNESRIRMTDPERTLLDGLMRPGLCGDFNEVLHAFDTHAPRLDTDRIIRYALQLDTATAKRLGWILERGGVTPSRLDPLRKIPSKGYRCLNPIGPRQGPCDRGWMVQVNLPGKVRG